MIDLRDRVIAIVGGDDREQEIARQATAAGAHVRAYGFPWPDEGIRGVRRTDSGAEAMDGAHYALFPIPGIAEDGALFAPAAPDPIVPDAELLSRLAPGAAIILGAADERLRRAASAQGVSLVEYESDQELMILRGPAIVEGALQRAIAETDVTIHAATVAVVGQGNIGKMLTRTLIALGARAHVIARNPVQRAEAYAAGAVPHSLDAFGEIAQSLAMLFSTVPARVVDRSVLSQIPPGALVMDLAAPPGGVDLDAAAELGHRAVWARGLGRRAPVTVGRSQWQGILERIRRLEGWPSC